MSMFAADIDELGGMFAADLEQLDEALEDDDLDLELSGAVVGRHLDDDLDQDQDLDLDQDDEDLDLDQDEGVDLDQDVDDLLEQPIVGREPMTYATVKKLVYKTGRAIDAAKKGARPSRAVVDRAVLGDLDAQIACAALEYAADHPCGCAKKKKPPPLLPESEHERGWVVLARGD